MGEEFSGIQLPIRLTSFIARERETEVVLSLLTTHRLVVLTGSGGCGKTRLAIHVATQEAAAYPDGTVWVDLSVSPPGADVSGLFAEAVGVSDRFGGSLVDAVAARLRPSRALMVVDNCEHVAEMAGQIITRILTACPGVKVLATSRTPIGVDGEMLFRVPSLDVMDGERSAAARLFRDRAILAQHTFSLDERAAATVSEICRQLDGMPLAIELAAARLRMHDLEELAASLRGRLELLAAPGPKRVQRQGTIDASVRWSYELLDERERVVIERLSVFRGSFTLAAARAVVSDDDLPPGEVLGSLSALVDHSLVEADIDPAGTRYRLLETIRTFSADRLAESPTGSDVIVRRHVGYHRQLVEHASELIEDGQAFAALDLLVPEEANLLAAFERAEASGDIGSQLTIASSHYWDLRGRSPSFGGALQRLIDDERCSTEIRTVASIAAARLASSRWDLVESHQLATIALDLARINHDKRVEAESLAILGVAALWTGQREDARSKLEEARHLAEELGDGSIVALVTSSLGQLPFALGDMPPARLLFETAVDLARRYGALRTLFITDAYLVLLHWFAGRDDAGAASCEEGLHISRLSGATFGESMFLSFKAAHHLRRGETDEASALLDRAAVLADVSGHPLAFGHLMTQRAFLALASGDLEHALDAHENCAQVARQMSITLAGVLHSCVAADVASALGEHERAASDLAIATQWEADIGADFAMAAAARSAVALDAGQLDEAEEHAHHAITLGAETDAPVSQVEGLELLAAVWARTGRAEEAGRILGAADSIRSARSWTRWPTMRSRIDAAGLLIDEASRHAFDEGASMSLHEAVSYVRRGRGERKRPAFGWASLTPSESRVVELVAEGLSNAEIASRLFISVATVKTHLTHVYAKTSTGSRVQLARAYSQQSSDAAER